VSRSAVPRFLSRPARGIAAVAVALTFLTACGGDSDADGDAAATTAETSSPAEESETPSGDTEGGETQTITATEGDFSISLDEDGLAPGTYEIEVLNEGSATHDLVVERDGEDVAASETIAPGESITLSVELEAGDYVFYCSIGNHREMGMEIDVSVA
jgi:plastocyanin